MTWTMQTAQRMAERLSARTGEPEDRYVVIAVDAENNPSPMGFERYCDEMWDAEETAAWMAEERLYTSATAIHIYDRQTSQLCGNHPVGASMDHGSLLNVA